MDVALHPRAQDIVRLGVVVAEGAPWLDKDGVPRTEESPAASSEPEHEARLPVVTLARHEALDAAVQALEAETREAYGAVTALSEVAEIAAVRRMFHAFGVDPTRHRPSSESLLRRVLRNGSLPRVHPVVDVSNVCSLEFLLPIGSYNADAIRGGVTCRFGREGEAIEAIGRRVTLVENHLVLADGDGPFGGPICDATRTMVTEAVNKTLTALFIPRDVPARLAGVRTRRTADRLGELLGWTILEARMVE
jgi:DNA/RNA-binding domain of Phe-tRNA-synthetase-like protein